MLKSKGVFKHLQRCPMKNKRTPKQPEGDFPEVQPCMKFVLPLHHSLGFPHFHLLGKASALDCFGGFFFHSNFQMKPHQIIWYGEKGKEQSGLRGGKTPDQHLPGNFCHLFHFCAQKEESFLPNQTPPALQPYLKHHQIHLQRRYYGFRM